MSQIDELIEKHCPDGVEWKTLGEVGMFVHGNGFQKKDFTESGVGCIHYGQLYTHYGIYAKQTKTFISTAIANKAKKAQTGDLIITDTSEDDEDLCKAVVWLGDEEIAISNHTFIYKHSLNPKYVSYFFQTDEFQQQKRPYITGVKVRSISAKNISKIKIPIPPLSVQQEIVSILDRFTTLEAELEMELEAELEARRKQYEYYRKVLLSFNDELIEKHCPDGVEYGTIESICKKVCSGGTPESTNQSYYGGQIPWLRTQDIDYKPILSTSMTITEKGLKNSAAKWIPENCVIVAMYGATAAKAATNSIELTTNQACCNLEIDHEKANYKFVYYWISNEYSKLKNLGQGSQSNLNARIIRKYKIPIPPLDEQARIVAILDRFDALVNDISTGLSAEIVARRKQYKYYCDRLLTFREVT